MKTGVADPFRFLHGTLNVLVIDADAAYLKSAVTPILAPIRCCNVEYAGSNAGALVHLRSGRRFHVCITELGFYDMDNDEYAIIRQYSQHCSIMVLTGQQSPAKGAACMQLGARAVFDKHGQFNRHAFMNAFTRMALINIVNCRYNEWSGDTLNVATRILFEKDPVSVTEWAEHMRITDRQLRNLWHRGSGFGAKQMLFLYGCFKNALLFYENRLFGNENDHGVASKYFRKHYEQYFGMHRETLQFLLS